MAPYPGFSGGPVLDTAGRMVGMATAGVHRGAALAIPSRTLHGLVQDLATHGRIRRGFVGITTMAVEVSPAQQGPGGERCGLLVTSLAADGPAARAGALVGDVILAIDGRGVQTPEDLLAFLDREAIGRTVPLTVMRGTRAESFPIAIGERGVRRS
jgi:S1-C subfamily serine protease